jgi:hypothetical protein
MAVAAIVIAAAAPFAEDPVLERFNIRTPMALKVAELTQQASQREQQVAELEKQLAATATKLAKQEKDTSAAGARVQAIQVWARTMVLVQLGAALRRPGPFDLELTMPRATDAVPSEWMPLLTRIEPYAATGVPGVPQLQRDFITLRARVEANENGSAPIAWVNRMITWPRGAETRPTDEAAEPGPASRIFGELADALGRDNLAGAVAIAHKISGMSRDVLNDWVEDAEARVALDELARRVNDLVVQRRTGAAGTSAQ